MHAWVCMYLYILKILGMYVFIYPQKNMIIVNIYPQRLLLFSKYHIIKVYVYMHAWVCMYL